MKAVLGFLFILAGLAMGWLVLSGKLPNANPTIPATTTPLVPATGKGTKAVGVDRPKTNNPLQIPTYTGLGDVKTYRGV